MTVKLERKMYQFLINRIGDREYMSEIYCPKCKTLLENDEIEIGKCLSCGAIFEKAAIEKKIYKTNSHNVKHINTVAEILKVIGVFILVIGTIASICVGCISKEFSFVLFFVMEIEVFIGGIIFIGFSEIIKLLQDIKAKMK